MTSRGTSSVRREQRTRDAPRLSSVRRRVLVLGWNRPLQARFRGRASEAQRLAGDALRQSLDERESKRRREEAMSQRVDLENGYVPIGTVVTVRERSSVYFRDGSPNRTGQRSATSARFGGSPVITVRLGTDEFVLNRDTKRAAVHTFLAAAAEAGGADRLRWHVTTNARGAVNRVTYRSDDAPTPGWYAYVRGVTEPRDLE